MDASSLLFIAPEFSERTLERHVARYLAWADRLQPSRHSCVFVYRHPTATLPDLSDDRIRIGGIVELRASIREADSIIASELRLLPWLMLQRSSRPVIFDATAPPLVTDLARRSLSESSPQEDHEAARVRRLQRAALLADAVLCLTSRQCSALLEVARGQATPADFSSLLPTEDGCLYVNAESAFPPTGAATPNPRDAASVFDIPRDAVILLWAGEITNTSDPLTWIEAVSALRLRNRSVHLVFARLGLEPYDAEELSTLREAVSRAESTGALNNNVWFDFGGGVGIEATARQSDSVIGVCGHLPHKWSDLEWCERIPRLLGANIPVISLQTEPWLNNGKAGDAVSVWDGKSIDGLESLIGRISGSDRRRHSSGKTTASPGDSGSLRDGKSIADILQQASRRRRRMLAGLSSETTYRIAQLRRRSSHRRTGR